MQDATKARTAPLIQDLPPAKPVQLDSSLAIKMSLGGALFYEKTLLSRTDVWHKVNIIRGAKYDQEFILKTILNAVEPADLIPIRYQITGEDSSFLARNCGPALEKLCRSSLIIHCPNGDSLALVIILAFATHDTLKVQPFLQQALRKRYDPKKKLLNLERFHKSSDIYGTVYFPLSQPKMFTNVLKISKNQLPAIKHLNLQRNELIDISVMESNEKCSLNQLTSLDLRFNNLISMSVLSPLKNLKITEAWLDGNPLCENYFSVKQYIESAKTYLPCLQKLDGVNISASGNTPLTYITYMKNFKRKKLVELFIHHFFTLYDQADRQALKGIYDKHALFSLTFGVPDGLAKVKNLGEFIGSCRNFLRHCNISKSMDLLCQGEEEILDMFSILPRSQHDLSTIQYDLIYDKDGCLVLCVDGIFRNFKEGIQVLYFNRTFVLVRGEDDEYNIVNDQYHIDIVAVVRCDSYLEQRKPFEVLPTCFSPTEKRKITEDMKKTTKMNEAWSKKYLDAAKWNLREAISNFVQDFQAYQVPNIAFESVIGGQK